MSDENINFEESLNNLSSIVEKLENDELDIDTSINLYKDGITLSSKLSKKLKQYEKQIFELKKLSDDSFALDEFNETIQ